MSTKEGCLRLNVPMTRRRLVEDVPMNTAAAPRWTVSIGDSFPRLDLLVFVSPSTYFTIKTHV